MPTIDLNCDVGERQPHQQRNFDEEIMPFVSSCNIACGFHSGSPTIIENTIRAAIKHDVKIGAHPSYNDREHFGRISLTVDPKVLQAELRYQIGAVKGMVESYGGKLHHVKPHGALYNDMAADPKIAATIVQVVKAIDPNLKIFVLAGSQGMAVCKAYGMAYVSEGFVDRKYERVDQLRSRRLAGAVLHEPAMVLAQVDNFLKGKVELWGGQEKAIKVESICLHSDTEGAIALSQLIYNFLKEKNVNIAAVR